MKNLTIKQLKEKVSEPILIDCQYNSLTKHMDHKSLRFNPITQEYIILQYGKQVNTSYLAETALKYYNEIKF